MQLVFAIHVVPSEMQLIEDELQFSLLKMLQLVNVIHDSSLYAQSVNNKQESYDYDEHSFELEYVEFVIHYSPFHIQASE